MDWDTDISLRAKLRRKKTALGKAVNQRGDMQGREGARCTIETYNIVDHDMGKIDVADK